jgi:hypothetical protein
MAEDKNYMVEGMYQYTDDFGKGGINGMHHNVVGWDNTTVGMASSVFDNLLSQNGIKSFDPNHIGALEPIRAGKFIVKWLKVPAFFDAVAVKYLKFFLENAVRSVEGIADNQINASGSVTFGPNGQQFDFPGQLTQGNKDVTLNTITCTGDGLGKLMRYWMYGITDPVTNIHHMYGKDLRFIRPNYSGTLLYVFLGPTCRPGDIEYACLWNEVWPSSPDGISKFNSGEIGSDTAVDAQSVTLSGIFQDGPEVNILAKYIVAGTGLAGQSYFEQMLPAYMYDKYIGPLDNSATRKDVQEKLDMTIKTRMASEAAGNVYGTAMGTRQTVTEQYGINTSAVSGEATRTVEGMYGELSGDGKFKVSDFVEK